MQVFRLSHQERATHDSARCSPHEELWKRVSSTRRAELYSSAFHIWVSLRLIH
jgi:hypothetical protein